MIADKDLFISTVPQASPQKGSDLHVVSKTVSLSNEVNIEYYDSWVILHMLLQ